MTTEELIKYLSTLPKDTIIKVAVADGCEYENWTTFKDLKIEGNSYYNESSKELELGDDAR